MSASEGADGWKRNGPSPLLLVASAACSPPSDRPSAEPLREERSAEPAAGDVESPQRPSPTATPTDEPDPIPAPPQGRMVVHVFYVCWIAGTERRVGCWGSEWTESLRSHGRARIERSVEVAGLQGVQQLSQWNEAICALRDDGVWCWGGLSDRRVVERPVRIPELDGVAQISDGCALGQDGELLCGSSVSDVARVEGWGIDHIPRNPHHGLPGFVRLDADGGVTNEAFHFEVTIPDGVTFNQRLPAPTLRR